MIEFNILDFPIHKSFKKYVQANLNYLFTRINLSPTFGNFNHKKIQNLKELFNMNLLFLVKYKK